MPSWASARPTWVSVLLSTGSPAYAGALLGVFDGLDALAHRLAPLGSLEKNRFLLRANIDDYQLTIFANGRAIISGTYDLAVAKSLYSRYVGA